MIQVFVNSIQQPEEEFLRVMLGVTSELKGTPGHHILKQNKLIVCWWITQKQPLPPSLQDFA